MSASERNEILRQLELLSAREYEIMMAIASGERPALTARRLKIHVKTVNTYRTRVLEKLELHSNAEVAVSAYKAGVLE